MLGRADRAVVKFDLVNTIAPIFSARDDPSNTLPCGTLVKVTYHGRALTLPVLDRGPYSHVADWDLTAGAAQALNVGDTVRIGTRVVGSVPNSPLLGLPAEPISAPLAGGAAAG